VVYLVDVWGRIGYVGQSMTGPARLSALEIMAWQHGSGFSLDPWEFEVIRDMSSAYISGHTDGEDPASAPPFGVIDQTYDREVVSKKVTSIFGALARKSA